MRVASLLNLILIGVIACQPFNVFSAPDLDAFDEKHPKVVKLVRFLTDFFLKSVNTTPDAPFKFLKLPNDLLEDGSLEIEAGVPAINFSKRSWETSFRKNETPDQHSREIPLVGLPGLILLLGVQSLLQDDLNVATFKPNGMDYFKELIDNKIILSDYLAAHYFFTSSVTKNKANDRFSPRFTLIIPQATICRNQELFLLDKKGSALLQTIHNTDEQLSMLFYNCFDPRFKSFFEEIVPTLLKNANMYNQYHFPKIDLDPNQLLDDIGTGSQLRVALQNTLRVNHFSYCLLYSTWSRTVSIDNVPAPDDVCGPEATLSVPVPETVRLLSLSTAQFDHFQIQIVHIKPKDATDSTDSTDSTNSEDKSVLMNEDQEVAPPEKTFEPFTNPSDTSSEEEIVNVPFRNPAGNLQPLRVPRIPELENLINLSSSESEDENADRLRPVFPVVRPNQPGGDIEDPFGSGREFSNQGPPSLVGPLNPLRPPGTFGSGGQIPESGRPNVLELPNPPSDLIGFSSSESEDENADRLRPKLPVVRPNQPGGNLDQPPGSRIESSGPHVPGLVGPLNPLRPPNLSDIEKLFTTSESESELEELVPSKPILDAYPFRPRSSSYGGEKSKWFDSGTESDKLSSRNSILTLHPVRPIRKDDIMISDTSSYEILDMPTDKSEKKKLVDSRVASPESSLNIFGTSTSDETSLKSKETNKTYPPGRIEQRKKRRKKRVPKSAIDTISDSTALSETESETSTSNTYANDISDELSALRHVGLPLLFTESGSPSPSDPNTSDDDDSSIMQKFRKIIFKARPLKQVMNSNQNVAGTSKQLNVLKVVPSSPVRPSQSEEPIAGPSNKIVSRPKTFRFEAISLLIPSRPVLGSQTSQMKTKQNRKPSRPVASFSDTE